MNIIEVSVVGLVCFYLGMTFMAYWVEATRQNRLEDQLAKQLIHIKAPRNTYLETCIRCGKKFDISTTEDPEFELCQDCMNHLKNHPEDPYFQRKGA